MKIIKLKDEEIEILEKNSALIQISNKMDLKQRQGLNIMFKQALKEMEKNESKTVFEISLKDFKLKSGIKAKDRLQIAKQFRELQTTIIEYNILGKTKSKNWGSFPLLAGIELIDGNITFSFPHQIIKALKNKTTKGLIDLDIQKKFSNKHSLALYELACDYRKEGIPKMSIAVYRKLLGLEDKDYARPYDFNKNCIEKPFEDINEHSDLKLSYELFKVNSRRATHILIKITEKNCNSEIKVIQDKIILDILEESNRKDITVKEIKEVLKKYNNREIEFLYFCLRKTIKENLKYKRALTRNVNNVDIYKEYLLVKDLKDNKN